MKLVESPRERLKSVTLGLATDQSGPNVVAGIFFGAVFTTLAGMTPTWYPALPGLGWLASIIIYAYADEVKQEIEERRNRLLEPESEYYGIE